MKRPSAGKPKILFVCYGNICRSPMAWAMAAARVGDRAEVRSAGLAAQGGPASEEAVLTMKMVYKLDIARHVATPVGALRLGNYDHVVALDYFVYRQLREIWGVPESKLHAWDVDDPLGRGLEAYKEAARKIERRLGQLLTELGLE